MRRKTKIVLAITFMVAVLVMAFSYIYISELLRQRVTTARESAAQLTSNLAYLAANAAPDLSSTKVDTTNPLAMRRAVAYYLGTDRDLNNFLESVVGTWPIIYDAAIVDSDGKAILHTNPDLIGKPVPERPDFHVVENAGFRRQFDVVIDAARAHLDEDRHLPVGGLAKFLDLDDHVIRPQKIWMPRRTALIDSNRKVPLLGNAIGNFRSQK